MRKCKVYEHIGEFGQKRLARNKLLADWKEETGAINAINFPQPSDEAIDAERKHFPLSTFVCNALFHEWGQEGSEDGDRYTVAIVEQLDGQVAVYSAEAITFEVSDNEEATTINRDNLP